MMLSFNHIYCRGVVGSVHLVATPILFLEVSPQTMPIVQKRHVNGTYHTINISHTDSLSDCARHGYRLVSQWRGVAKVNGRGYAHSPLTPHQQGPRANHSCQAQLEAAAHTCTAHGHLGYVKLGLLGCFSRTGQKKRKTHVAQSMAMQTESLCNSLFLPLKDFHGIVQRYERTVIAVYSHTTNNQNVIARNKFYGQISGKGR